MPLLLLGNGQDFLISPIILLITQVLPGTIAAFAVAGVLDWLLVGVCLWRGVTVYLMTFHQWPLSIVCTYY